MADEKRGSMSGIKTKTLRTIILSQGLVLVLFLAMTITNEVLDLPYHLLGDMPTSIEQRTGEVAIEAAILVLIVAIEMVLMIKLYRRIRILEGFLPICANCKKIRHEGDWVRIETYIETHSHTQFTHSICPECLEKLYPDYVAEKKGKL